MKINIPKSSDYACGISCGIKESVSVSFAGGLFGFVFGVLAPTYGLTGFQSLLMSLWIYAGTAQVIALDILSHPPFSIGTLLIMIVVIFSRYFLMWFSLHALVKPVSKKSQALSLFFLVRCGLLGVCRESRK